MSDSSPSPRRGRARSKSFIAEDDDPLDLATSLPISALQDRPPVTPPSPRSRGRSRSPGSRRSGALRRHEKDIVSNLAAAARSTPPSSGRIRGPALMPTGISPRSEDDAEAEAEEMRLCAEEEAMRRSGGAGGAGAGSSRSSGRGEDCVRLLLLGDSGVGKTSLINRYTQGKFLNTIMTAGIDYRVNHITVGKKRVKLQIWDTAGQERFHILTKSYFRGADGIILVYDVSDVAQAASFHNVKMWMKTIHDTAGTGGVTTVLVGNKVDLPGPKIDSKRGQGMADEYKMPHFQTSAKTGSGVKKVFLTITKDVLRRRQEEAAAAEARAKLEADGVDLAAASTGKKKKGKCTIM